jgi:predicted O-linked N-acetylglucosamine transferase (SPINDLY family)
MTLAITLIQQGKHAQGEHYYSRCIELQPKSAAARSDHGHALMMVDRLKDAQSRFKEAMALDPTLANGHIGYIQSLMRQADFRQAAQAASQAIQHCPLSPEIHSLLSYALLAIGRADDSAAAARRAIQALPGEQRPLSSLATALTYSDTATPDEVIAAYAANGRALMAGIPPPPPFANTPLPDRPLNIGYLSSDFREHSVNYFLEPILTHHTPAFRIFCYSTVRHVDAVTNRLKALIDSRRGLWVESLNLSTDALVQRIRADRIDILIDLGGHSHGGRLAVIARRPAPVQVNYIGWPTTTGLPAVDWRIVDAVTDPPAANRLSTERLARIDPCFLCYAGSPDAPDPVPAPARQPVFGSLNAVLKTNPTCVRAWSSVLHAVPGSRMIVKAAQLEFEAQQNHIMSLFATNSIGRERFDLIPRIDNARAHLDTYNRIDVALDTFPYNGTTTTCEALWMGVPVVTTQGSMHAGRVSFSLLSAIGSPEFAARDEAEFIRIASTLAQDRTKLSELKLTLRDRMKSSPLCNAAAFTAKLESVYRVMWLDWCKSRSAPKI